MPSPSVNTNINAVPLDYFLRGVEAAKPSSVSTAAENKQGNENAPVAPEEPRGAGKLVAQLDVLLLKAAKASTQSLDGKTVKQTFQKLVDGGVLDRSSFKLLGKAADTAAKTLKALDKFTGQDLAAAFGADGKFDATSKVGKAILAAMTAQQELSELFSQLSERLDSHSLHDDSALLPNAQPSPDEGLSALRMEADEMRLLCDRRATEIIGLAYKMNDFAVNLAANGQNTDPNVVAILKAKVNELLPRQALAMHGTADALATVSQTVSERLRPLAEKIDAFRRNPSITLKSQDYLALQSDISRMKAAIVDIRKNGIEVGGGRLMVADDIMKALETEVAKAENLFKTARQEVTRTVLANYLETVENLFCEHSGYEFQQANSDDNLANMLELRNETLNAMTKLCEAALDPSKTKEEDLKPSIIALQKVSGALWKAADKTNLGMGASAERMNKIIDRCRAIGTVVVDFGNAVLRLHGGDRFFTGAEAMGVFEGKISVSSVVEARARGLSTADVDPANEDANIVSERKLGAGVAGEVYELQRSNGTSVVFKGETESRTGLNAIAAGGGNSYAKEQQTVNLNIATKKAATALGMGDSIVNYSAGTHKGVFGFFMEKAKGLTGKAFAAGNSSSAPDAGLSTKEIKRLPPAQRQQVKAGLMRELNRLQWLDLLTGQNDRHWENYFIHVDRETLKVTVKGIDNDAGYSQYRTGAVKYTFDKKRTETFKALLVGIAKKIDSRNYTAEYNRLLNDPGITFDEKSSKITVDASKLSNKAIGQAISRLTGVHSLAIPDKIDRSTYNSLMTLKQDPARKEYLDSIRPRLSKESYDAAVSRLDDVIAHAEKLKPEQIIDENGWTNVQEAPLATGKVSVIKDNGQQKLLGGEIAKDVNEAFCSSYFARDGISKQF